MSQLDSSLTSAVARWVFGFVRFQLGCGLTLNEVDISLSRALANGELQEFMDTFADLAAANAQARRTRTGLAQVNEERRKYERL
jgi:hypothetical protein